MRRLPWAVAHKLNLYVFLVDAKSQVKRYDWRELKARQPCGCADAGSSSKENVTPPADNLGR